MPKFLVILPVSIAGTLIMKGLASALNACGFLAVAKDIREIAPSDPEELEVTSILSYDYGFLHNEALAKYLSENMGKYNLINYFADDPHSSFANAVGNDFYNELKKFNPYIFMWDKTYLNQFENSYYLPLGVNTDLYETDLLANPRYDITFVGRPLGEKRQKILSSLSKVYGSRLKIFSYEKHFLNGADEMLAKGLLNQSEYECFKKSYVRFVRTERELADIYSHSKINLNITIQGANNMNYRVFEVLASCGFLMTDFQKCLKEYFISGTDLETYENEVELIDKIDFYLKNPSIAKRISFNGFEKVINNHSFIDRARNILAVVENK